MAVSAGRTRRMLCGALCVALTLGVIGRAIARAATALPTLSVAVASVTEGSSGTRALVFTVRASTASSSVMSLHYATVNGSAKAPGDYAATSGTASIAARATSTTISVTVVGDTLREGNETLTLNLSSPVNATLSTSTVTGTIVDDDPVPKISVASASTTEGNSGVHALTFTATLSAVSGLASSFRYATANGTATAPADYTTASGTVTIAAGVRTATFAVSVVGDTRHEATETFTVALSNATNATLASTSAAGTIVDDDAAPVLSILGTSVTEGNSGNQVATFRITQSAVSGTATTVRYGTVNGTAVAPSDYTAVSGTATIAAGATGTSVNVAVVGDTTVEPNETFSMKLSSPVNATLGTATAVATIIDDDAAPTLTVSPVSVTEGNSGTTNAVFRITASAARSTTVSVHFATSNGTAIAPGDYVATSGTATIAAGATSTTVNVAVNGDLLHEGNETFTLTLSSPVNATIATGSATGTVVDDDPVPVVKVSGSSVVEGTGGTTSATFTVSLSAPSGLPATVSYATADGTATAPADYTATSGSVTIPAGATSAAVKVAVAPDSLHETNETFALVLSNPAGATLANPPSASTTIVDDDPVPVVSVGGTSVTEGNSGTVDAVFTVSASAPSALPLTVDYATADGSATAPADYTAASGTVTIAANATSATVHVAVVGDTVHEGDETFALVISNPSGATLGSSSAVATIVDDDPVPQVSAHDVSVAEGDDATTPAVVNLTLTNPSSTPVTVDWKTADGSATAPADYTAASGTATFAPGATSATATVWVNGDTLAEGDETLTVTLSNPAGAAIAAGVATVTIVDDDPVPALSVADVSVPSVDSGTTSATFTVHASATSGEPIGVDYATADGSATAPGDYTAATGTLTIPAGRTDGTVTVAVAGNRAPPGNETFTLTISNPQGATIIDPTATATVVAEHRMGLATGGLYYNLDAAHREAEMTDLQGTGDRWMRTTFQWRDIEATQGQYDWSVADSIVASANAHHIALVLTVSGAPSWAVPNVDPSQLRDFSTDPTLYAGFLHVLVQRYAPQGVLVYEIGNEENNVRAANPDPDPAAYTAVLCDANAAVKSVAPGATVLTAGLGGLDDTDGNISGPNFLAALYADGARGCFDAVSYHPYTYPLSPPDDGTRSWSAMLRARQVMETNGDAAKRIWVTEFGAPTNGPVAKRTVTEAVQAQLLDQGYRLFASYPWAGPFCWFQYQDKSADPTQQSDWFGLYRFDGSAKPSYSTFVNDASTAIP